MINYEGESLFTFMTENAENIPDCTTVKSEGNFSAHTLSHAHSHTHTHKYIHTHRKNDQ